MIWPFEQKDLKVHFVGIGGIGMSGIAEVLLQDGYTISGSDLTKSDITKRLESLGAKVYYSHSAGNIADADVVVTSSAVRESNPEVEAAKQAKTPIIPRAEMLGELMKSRLGIAIAGTHGKTTTTSMVATMLVESDMDPTIIIGGRLNALGSNAKLGKGKVLVAEADESDRSFLHIPSTVAVVTNIDNDHLNNYQNMDELRSAFVEFVNKIPFYGKAIICVDDDNVRSVMPKINKPYITYGFSPQADLQARSIAYNDFGSEFEVFFERNLLGKVNCNLPGDHNILNTLAAIAVGLNMKIDFKDIQKGLSSFQGVRRRFELKGKKNEITFVDDYGHHPTEIEATLAGARKFWKGRIVACFQPHRYSRTKDCYSEFVRSFDNADTLFVLNIYPAGEDPIKGITGEKLAHDIHLHGHREVSYAGQVDEAVAVIESQLKAGDLFITLGAGNVYQVGEKILASQ